VSEPAPSAEGKISATLAADGTRLDVTIGGRGSVLDSEAIAQLGATAEEFAATAPALRAITIAGAGKHFSFGASVEEHRPDQVTSMLMRFHGLFRRLAKLAVPTIAVVRGQCLGGGLELAAWCSWVFAAPDARFGQPEIKLGVFPPLASVLLPWRLGGAAALDLCVSGRTIDAATAHRIGLVHTIADDPAAAAAEFVAAELASCSPSSLRFAERAVRLGLMRKLADELPAMERLYLEELMRTLDAVEGIEAFLAKRPPAWRGAHS